MKMSLVKCLLESLVSFNVKHSNKNPALDGTAVPVIRLPSIVGEQGSRRMDLPKQQSKPTAFEIFEDEERPQEKYLEAIYDIHNEAHSSYVERYALKDNNAIKLIPNEVRYKIFLYEFLQDGSKKIVSASSSFAIWYDEKENVDPNHNTTVKKKCELKQKPKLAFKKELLQTSIEVSYGINTCNKFHKEMLAERYLADLPIRRRLNFDDD